MPNWSRLILPLGFGLLAAAVNWVAMQRHIKPDDFVVVKSEVMIGELVTESHIQKLSCNFQVEQLGKLVVPWRNRYEILGRVATRRMVKGDPVLRRDVSPDQIDFRAVDKDNARLLVTFIAEERRFLNDDIVPGETISIKLIDEDETSELTGLFVQKIVNTADGVQLSVFVRADNENLQRLGRAVYGLGALIKSISRDNG
jgi:hypothetical protein